MSFTPTPHTPAQWQNAPSTATPLDAAHLEAAEVDLVTYTQQTAQDIVNWEGKKVLDGRNYLSTIATNNTAGLAQMLTDAAITGDPTILQLPQGNFSFTGSVTNWPIGLPVSMRGMGMGSTGIVGTRLQRTAGVAPLLSGVGSGMPLANRVYPDLRDLEISGGNLGGTLVSFSRTMHAVLDKVRIANNIGGIGLRCTQWYDSFIPLLVVEVCGGTGSFTGNTNSNRTISGVSSFTNIVPGTVLTHADLPSGTTVVSTNSGAGTITIDRTATGTHTGVTITWINPAHVFDATIGDGSQGGCATVKCGLGRYQSNYGTDLRYTGSLDDSAPSVDIGWNSLSMESTGAGTIGTPDTYPYIDLDYAQSCASARTRVSIPSGRAPTSVIQQINALGTAIGTRSNTFSATTLDNAGSNQPTRFIDHAVGALRFNGLEFINSPTTDHIRIQSTVAPSLFGIKDCPFTGTGAVPLINDQRAIDEQLTFGRIWVPWEGTSTAFTSQNDQQVVNAAHNQTPVWNGAVTIPWDAIPGNVAFEFLYYFDGAPGGGNISWLCLSANSFKSGDDATIPSGSYAAIKAAPGGALYDRASTAAGGVFNTSSGPSVRPGDTLRVNGIRFGTDATDTCTTTARWLGMNVIYRRKI